MEKTVAVLGGDERMNFAARELVRLGYDVREWGRSEEDSATAFAKTAHDWFLGIDALMLPLPTSLDGTHLWTPLLQEAEKLRMETLFKVAPKQVWLVGRFGESLRFRADLEGIDWIDYFESEVLQLKKRTSNSGGSN